MPNGLLLNSCIRFSDTSLSLCLMLEEIMKLQPRMGLTCVSERFSLVSLSLKVLPSKPNIPMTFVAEVGACSDKLKLRDYLRAKPRTLLLTCGWGGLVADDAAFPADNLTINSLANVLENIRLWFVSEAV